MAHQMSPPQRPAQRPYSPYQQQMAHSPPGIALPPAKRQRLSPGASSPQMAHGTIPDSPYGPYSAVTPGAPQSFNTPQAFSSSPPPGTMGPPPRPNAAQKPEKEEKEKISDISDISDAIFGSGVDLREEENYLTNTFRNQHSQQSFNQSFDSSTTGQSANSSFGQMSQGGYGSQSAFSGSGPISQAVETKESIEEELNRKHRAAARAYAQQNEHHLRSPFLWGNVVRHRTHKIALEQGVSLDIKGLYEPEKKQPPPPSQPQRINGVTATGPDSVGVVAVRGQSIPETQPHAILDESARYADILSLLSLAANDRIRTILDETYTIARGRRYGSHGVVPPDLQDLATGEGKREASIKQESITGTSWDQVDGENREGSEAKDSRPEPTVSFTSSLTSHLQNLAVSDRDAELARIRKRQDRAKRAAAAEKAALEGGLDTSTPGPGTTGTTSPATPATPSGEFASQIAPEKPMTKKERERQSKLGQTEEVLHKNANSTAAMQLGFGKKAKRYSWMSSAPGATNPFAKSAAPKPVAVSNTNGVKQEGGKAQPVEKGMQARERKWGSWREDGIEGRGMQMRDLTAVLERDGKDRKALHRGLMNMGSLEEKEQ